MRYKTEAWTMIETLIVIAITLVLSAGVGVPALQYIERARSAAARMQMETLRLALHQYYMDCGRFPTTAQGLKALREKPVIAPVSNQWAGPYLERTVPADPWGRPWIYNSPGYGRLPWTLHSLGADGKEGGSGYDTDIRSWE